MVGAIFINIYSIMHLGYSEINLCILMAMCVCVCILNAKPAGLMTRPWPALVSKPEVGVMVASYSCTMRNKQVTQ